MMKASLYNPQHFLFSLRISLLLVLVTITWHISVTECADLPLSGEVGGNVTIHCPFHKDRKILFLYFQKGDTFVNGYYEDREMDHKKVQKWSNTRLDRGNNTVYMYNLTVAHSGEYQCHIKYRSGVLMVNKIHLSVTANYSKPEVKQYCSGEVGGNVTIHCPFHKDRKILFLYFQKGDTFVNGYYEDREMDHKKVQKWSNTRLDRGNNTVYMYNLTVAHSGEYQCHIKYRSGVLMENKIHLSVTANYSKPEVKQYCSSEKFGCLVTCASHGGYPDEEIVWNVDRAQMWNVVNISKTNDPHTMMFSVYSSAYYNCSNGPLEALSCSVGAVTSEMFSLCDTHTQTCLLRLRKRKNKFRDQAQMCSRSVKQHLKINSKSQRVSV